MSKVDTCFCDTDPPSIYEASRRRARVPHKCDECHGTIRPGERYEHCRALHEGQWETSRTCVYCLAVRDAVTARIPCFCWEHGNMLDSALEYADDAPGLRFTVLRLLVERNRARAER